MHITLRTAMNLSTSWLARNMTIISHNKHCTLKLLMQLVCTLGRLPPWGKISGNFWKFCPFLVNFVLIGDFVLIRMTHLHLHLHFYLFLPLHCLCRRCPIYPPLSYLTLLIHHTSLHLSSLGDSHCTAPTSLHFTAFTTLHPLTALPSLVFV